MKAIAKARLLILRYISYQPRHPEYNDFHLFEHLFGPRKKPTVARTGTKVFVKKWAGVKFSLLQIFVFCLALHVLFFYLANICKNMEDI